MEIVILGNLHDDLVTSILETKMKLIYYFGEKSIKYINDGFPSLILKDNYILTEDDVNYLKLVNEDSNTYGTILVIEDISSALGVFGEHLNILKQK